MSEGYRQFSTELNVGSVENAQAALKVYEQFQYDEDDEDEDVIPNVCGCMMTKETAILST